MRNDIEAKENGNLCQHINEERTFMQPTANCVLGFGDANENSKGAVTDLMVPGDTDEYYFLLSRFMEERGHHNKLCRNMPRFKNRNASQRTLRMFCSESWTCGEIFGSEQMKKCKGRAANKKDLGSSQTFW